MEKLHTEEDKHENQGDINEIQEEEDMNEEIDEKFQAEEDEPEIQIDQPEQLEATGPNDGADSGREDENTNEQLERAMQILNFSDVEKETFRNLYPSRNIFTFEEGFKISSNFDSGNLLKCTLGSVSE